jgi:hypothetical protein
LASGFCSSLHQAWALVWGSEFISNHMLTTMWCMHMEHAACALPSPDCLFKPKACSSCMASCSTMHGRRRTCLGMSYNFVAAYVKASLGMWVQQGTQRDRQGVLHARCCSHGPSIREVGGGGTGLLAQLSTGMVHDAATSHVSFGMRYAIWSWL